jgi:hypothetical protein
VVELSDVRCSGEHVDDITVKAFVGAEEEDVRVVICQIVAIEALYSAPAVHVISCKPVDLVACAEASKFKPGFVGEDTTRYIACFNNGG